MLDDGTDVTGVPLCPAAALAERGPAHGFDVLHLRQPARAFALRFDGEVRAYLNRCAHVPVEMDWQAGEFLDAERQLIVCSIHGALYDPQDGGCVAGPCSGSRLIALTVLEREAQVYWYPSYETQPAVGTCAASRPFASYSPESLP